MGGLGITALDIAVTDTSFLILQEYSFAQCDRNLVTAAMNHTVQLQKPTTAGTPKATRKQ